MKNLYCIQNNKNYEKVLYTLNKNGYTFTGTNDDALQFDGTIYLSVDFVGQTFSRKVIQSEDILCNGMDLCADVSDYELEMQLIIQYAMDGLMELVYEHMEDVSKWSKEGLNELNQYLCSDRQLLHDIWKDKQKGFFTSCREALDTWMEQHEIDCFNIRDYNYTLEGVK